MKKRSSTWWHFDDPAGAFPSTGQFETDAAGGIDRLYYPLFNETGALSWVSPRMQGALVAGHNEYHGLPLTAEDLPHVLAHRGFWLTGIDREPFSLAMAPDDFKLAGKGTASLLRLNVAAAPGWLRLTRRDPEERFHVEATLWCPSDLNEKAEILRVTVVNDSRRALRFTPYAALPVYARSASDVRDHRHVTALLNRVFVEPHGLTVCPTMTFDERGHKLNRMRYSVMALGPRSTGPDGIWPTQDAFLGEGGTFAAPAAVWRQEKAPKLGARQIQGREVCAGFRFRSIRLKPGASAAFTLISLVSDDPSGCGRCLKWARGKGRIDRSLETTAAHWRRQVQRIAFDTPDSDLNNWLTWVSLQPILRRHYGNSYLPQFDYGRGGKGWRDLWQDCLALLLSDPRSVRHLLLQNYGGVRIDGSNATIIGKGGTFLADRNNIPRTWMDHGVWPAYTTLLYIDQTGDIDFLLEPREYFRDPQLFRCRRRDDGWTSDYGYNLRTRAGKVYRGTVFEHMLVQNLTAFFNVGKHNLCRMEGADWNDGLDMADRNGESVAFSAFYAWNLNRLADTAALLQSRGHRIIEVAAEMTVLLDRLPGQKPVRYTSVPAKTKRLNDYLDDVARDVSGRTVNVRLDDLIRDLRAKSDDLFARIRRQEWVRAAPGLSFFNGYYDNHGRRVEGRHAKGIRMTLTGQVFPLMAGIADNTQIDAVIRSARKLLNDPLTGGVRLNTDFQTLQPDLGRAFSFAYGEKENGAVFSHMAVMYAFALYLRRRAREGRAVWHTLYKMVLDAGTSKIFPCVPEYFNAEGRGLYTYLTGSASWLIYLLLTRVYGLRGLNGDLVIDPQLTREDFDGQNRIRVRFPFAERNLEVTFENPNGLEAGRYRVQSIELNGKPLPFTRENEGARLARAALRRLATGQTARLTVRLS